MKENIERFITISSDFARTVLSNRAAVKALKVIEEEKGKLSKDIKSQCDNYAKKYLGDIKYAPWLYVYSAIQGEFKQGWIPDNYYGEVIVRGLDGIFSEPCELKPLSNRILKTNKLPDLLYVNNGVFIEPVNYKIIPNKEASEVLFNTEDTVIFKCNDSSQGRGVRFYTRDEWDTEQVKGKNGVYQKIIKQHEFFNKIFPHPGATLRITTVLNTDGEATVRAATLRIGRSNKESLSKHVQSNSAVKIAIDIKNGNLFDTGYMPDWSSIKSHPDTGVSFEGLTVPAFREACTEVENLHRNYPFVQCIGWDVSINDNGQVEIMEWNARHNDIKFSEAMYGPCFIDMLGRATGELINRSKS